MKNLIEFNIGDIAYILSFEWVKPECTNCSGTGKIFVTFKGNEIDVQCPDCNGTGRRGNKYKKYISQEIRINAIKIDRDGILYAFDTIWENDYEEWDWIYGELYKTKEEVELKIKEYTKLEEI